MDAKRFQEKIRSAVEGFANPNYSIQTLDNGKVFNILKSDGVIDCKVSATDELIGFEVSVNGKKYGIEDKRYLLEDTDLYALDHDLSVTQLIVGDVCRLIRALSENKIYYKIVQSNGLLRRNRLRLAIAILCENEKYLYFDKDAVNNFSLEEGDFESNYVVQELAMKRIE